MIINTKYHGEREYKEEDIITFEKGLPGFPDLRQFIIFPVDDNELFSVLHSVEDPAVGFVVISPFNVIDDYEFVLPENKAEELKIKDINDVLIINTVTLHSDYKKITTNLQAPIVININSKLGEQIILNNDKYLIKHPLFKE